MELNQITHEILDSAYKVHTALGPGMLESSYKACLAYELRKKEKSIALLTPSCLKATFPLSMGREGKSEPSEFGVSQKNQNVTFLFYSYLSSLR